MHLKGYCLPQSYFFHTKIIVVFRTDLHKMKIKHRIIGEYATKRFKQGQRKAWRIPSPKN